MGGLGKGIKSSASPSGLYENKRMDRQSIHDRVQIDLLSRMPGARGVRSYSDFEIFRQILPLNNCKIESPKCSEGFLFGGFA